MEREGELDTEGENFGNYQSTDGTERWNGQYHWMEGGIKRPENCGFQLRGTGMNERKTKHLRVTYPRVASYIRTQF